KKEQNKAFRVVFRQKQSKIFSFNQISHKMSVLTCYNSIGVKLFNGLINIVPGLGYLPLKSYQNALSTFLTTGFLYAMSAELYKENLNLSGTFFLSAGIIFHTGSYLGINKYNERITSKYKADLIRYLELRIP
ncbi:MAG: hypothetical protein ACOCG6_05665, partial [Candidatus Cloacimonadaceae bacterium]